MGEEQEQAFLEMLSYHEQTKTFPVVDLAFVKTLEVLSLEDQYKAMQYIDALTHNPQQVWGDIHERVNKGRLACLLHTWLEDMTQGWVHEVYDPPTQLPAYASGKGELEEVYTTQKEVGL